MKQLLILLFTASLLFVSVVNAKPSTQKYGPVKSGQTLWGIAYKTRPKGVSRLHMMRAIHKLNPDAFEKGNINLLKRGVTLKLPTSQEMVQHILSGQDIPAIAEEDEQDNNKDLETLRKELASVKAELEQSRETLKGLKEESAKLKQAQEEIATLKQENEQLKNSTTEAAENNEKLAELTRQLEAAQARIKTLEEEKVALQEKASQQQVPEDHEKTLKALASVTAELSKSQQLVKTLAEKNKQLQLESIDPKLFEETKQELATAREQLEAIKVQNQLLREQTANADVSEQERKEANRKFTDTIAALNADIGQLRARIKELEELEKMKDNHIAELQKSLDHATAVIKEQAEVNKKMYARLNALEKAEKERQQQDEQEENTPAAAAANSSGGSTPPSGGNPTDAQSIVNFADKTGNNSALAVSDSLKHISPKFWLMLTLAGLLFVLALLWRLIAGKDDEALT